MHTYIHTQTHTHKLLTDFVHEWHWKTIQYLPVGFNNTFKRLHTMIYLPLIQKNKEGSLCENNWMEHYIQNSVDHLNKSENARNRVQNPSLKILNEMRDRRNTIYHSKSYMTLL